MLSCCVRASCNFLYGHLATVQAKPYGGCAEMVQTSCNAGAVVVPSLQILHRNCKVFLRAPDSGHTDMVW